MNLPAFALRNRSIMMAAVVLLMGWGVLSYLGMPRREDPEYIVRTAQVLTTWVGAPTQKIEELVTYPLEKEINTLDGIRWVRSETTVGRVRDLRGTRTFDAGLRGRADVGQGAVAHGPRGDAGAGAQAHSHRRLRRHQHHAVRGAPEAAARRD